MGETPGYFIDAQAAEAILHKLSHLLNFEINAFIYDEEIISSVIDYFLEYNRSDKIVSLTEGMKKDIEISLKNLQTEYIDLYQMHNVKYEGI